MESVLIVTQPDYPVPPVNDGAQAIVIADTVCQLGRSAPWVISLGKPSSDIAVDSRIVHVDFSSLLIRVISRLLRILPGLKYMKSKKYVAVLVGIILFRLRKKINVLVVHSTKMNWLLELRRWFPNVKLVSYHHSSEDHLCDPRMLKLIAEGIDGHFFVSDFGRREFERAVFELTGKKIQAWTIQNGVDHRQFKLFPGKQVEWRGEFGLEANKITLLFAGRIIPRKGIHIVLDAIRNLPTALLGQIQLLIAGGADYFNTQVTPYRSEVADSVQALRGKLHVVELGYVPHKRIHEVFASADIYLFASLETEGCPLGLLEAASMALPVIAHNVGGIEEIVHHGQTGVLINPPFSVHKFSDAIQSLVLHLSERERIGRNAFDVSRQRFSSSRMAKDFEFAISQFMNRG